MNTADDVVGRLLKLVGFIGLSALTLRASRDSLWLSPNLPALFATRRTSDDLKAYSIAANPSPLYDLATF